MWARRRGGSRVGEGEGREVERMGVECRGGASLFFHATSLRGVGCVWGCLFLEGRSRFRTH